MDYALSRRNMIDSQLLTSKITDPWVVDAMAEIPREEFVPTAKKGIAYMDDSLEVGRGRYILEPMVFARMIQAAGLQKEDVVLDIGCSTGYSTAVLARIVGTVVAIEADEDLAATATANLAAIGADNSAVITAPLAEGYAKQAPYDVVFFNGSVPELPDAIKEQVADGGRVVVSKSGIASMSRVQLYIREGDLFSCRDLMEAGVPLLPGFEKEKGFVF